MRSTTLLLLACLFLPACGRLPHGKAGPKPVLVESPGWAAAFDAAGVPGTLVVYEAGQDRWRVHDAARARRRYMPASTYKVFHSLVALEEGVVSSSWARLPWDGTKRSIKAWNREHNMRTAMRHSVVWFYQAMARRIGSERMQHWLDEADYGNRTMGATIDTFWLEGELAISAVEQVQLLVRLRAEALPFTPAVQREVKAMMRLEETPACRLFGKTGWAARTTPMVGWFVGFVEAGERTVYFALNLDMRSGADAKHRTDIVRGVLKAEGLLPR